MYLRPSNGCHGDGTSNSSNNGGSSPPGHVAPDPPRPSQSGGHQDDGRQGDDAPASRCAECCCCCNAEACPPPKDAAVAGPSTLGPPSRTGRLRQAATAAGTGPAYRRAASCIEQNKYTHIWQMPLPVPGE